MEFGLVGRNSKEVRIADIRAIDVRQKSYAALLGIGNVDFDSSASRVRRCASRTCAVRMTSSSSSASSRVELSLQPGGALTPAASDRREERVFAIFSKIRSALPSCPLNIS